MALEDIFAEVAKKDMAGGKKLGLLYEEKYVDGNIKISLRSEVDPDGYLHCTVPFDGLETTKNYARAYFLSMVFNAAIYGMKRKKKDNKIKPTN